MPFLSRPAAVKFAHGAISVTGNFRGNNEDALHVDPAGRFFVVADGMGGQAAGEEASALAVEMIPRALAGTLNFKRDGKEKVAAACDRAVAEANAEIMAAGALHADQHQMGTTVVFLLAAGGVLYAGGVGDSRVYRLRGSDLEQLTTDHSLVQALVEAGTIRPADAATHRYKNVLYRYLGSKEGGQGSACKPVDHRRGDRFLLCSDGVTDGVDGDPLRDLLAAGDPPQATAEALVSAAEAGGSRDNITAVVADVL